MSIYGSVVSVLFQYTTRTCSGWQPVIDHHFVAAMCWSKDTGQVTLHHNDRYEGVSQPCLLYHYLQGFIWLQSLVCIPPSSRSVPPNQVWRATETSNIRRCTRRDRWGGRIWHEDWRKEQRSLYMLICICYLTLKLCYAVYITSLPLLTVDLLCITVEARIFH